MNTAARPTSRCLHEDIDIDWGSARDRADCMGEAPVKPLDDLDHPILRKAAADFPGGSRDAEVARESISGLSSPVWWKVKANRWRGAVYEDPETGQAWLCAAGYRRAGEATDFYKRFMAEVSAKGAGHFLPTDVDKKRHDQELRGRLLDAWDAELQHCARGAVRSVWFGGKEIFEVGSPRDPREAIARCTVECERDEIDGLVVVDLVVSIECLDFALLALTQWAEQVILTAIDAREQAWASLPAGGTSTASQMLEGEDIHLVEESWASAALPGRAVPGDTAHYAHRNRLTQSSIEGEGVKGLCGTWFVPRQDHEKLPKCSECEAVLRALPE